MIFQTFDSKNECAAVFANNQLSGMAQVDFSSLNRTWAWAPYLPSGIDFAKIYVGGKELDEVCPEEYKEEYEKASSKLKALYRSFLLAKINLNENCFYDLVSKGFLEDYAKVKTKICDWVFQNVEKPSNHDYLVRLQEVLHDISTRRLCIDSAAMNSEKHKKKVRDFIERMRSYPRKIVYDPFSVKTGRLTTTKDSFPILRFDKDLRRFIKPNNDMFLEIDYNAADLRSLFFIQGKEQPPIDIHDWNIQNIFGKDTDRDLAKKMMFGWLYDFEKRDDRLEKVYSRDYLLREHWDGKAVQNPFGRTIECDRDHAIPYLVQSTTADYVGRKLIEIFDLLKGKKSYLAFSIHDSIVIDFDWSERKLIFQILEIVRKDGFVATMKAGKDFENLKVIDL